MPASAEIPTTPPAPETARSERRRELVQLGPAAEDRQPVPAVPRSPSGAPVPVSA